MPRFVPRTPHALAWGLLLLPLLISVCTLRTSAQVRPAADSLDYFPYRTGDRWRIVHETNEYAPVVYTVLRDSAISTGGTVLFLNEVILGSSTGKVKVSVEGDVYSDPDSAAPHLLYRLRASLGDRWKPDLGGKAYITCAGIYPTTVLGRETMVKEFQRWEDLSEFGGPDSVWRATYRLARGFGLISERYPGAYFYISGAFLGGVEYGDMISSVERTDAARLQLWPNPFAESATLRYRLDSRELVRLTLSDALGRTVAVPVDGVQEAGEHAAAIDGAALLDGVYFYQLRVGSRVLSGSLLKRSAAR